MKKKHLSGISFIGIVVALSIWISSAGTSLGAQQPEGKVSPGLAKVIALVESGLGEEVVLAYVRNSPVPKPNADEVIHLHQAGVPASVITAILSKNGSANTSTAPEPVNGRTVAKPEPTASASAPVAQVDRPAVTYVQPQPTVVYAPYVPPSYAYPYYYPSYGYPYYRGYYSWPAISLGFSFGHYGHHHHGGHHWHGGHWRGGHHGGGHHGGGHHSGHGGGLRYVRHSGRH